jgi:16S rRNA (cytosine1407-C5)-methyltransferase
MNPSSTLAVEALAPQPGEEVLDLAAAPGGKSLMIADMMRDEGRLACVEPVKGRFFRLKDNLKRGRVNIAQLYLADGCAVGRKVPARFDRVMLDAPCSSEARVRLNEPDTWAHWSPRKVKETSRKQRKLLRSALESVKVGGRVVYSTCALSPEENEGTITDVLKRFEGEVEVLPHTLEGIPSLPGLTEWEGEALDPRCEHALRVAPNGLYDAFFLCVLERRS